MISEQLIRENLVDIEREFVDYLIDHFAEWEVWAKASERVAAGEEVNEEEVPKSFHTELKITRLIVEMTSIGEFDWNHPKVKQIFQELASAPFYSLFGRTITKISLQLAKLASINTLLEIGAGKANLTGIMLQEMSREKNFYPIMTTDSHDIIFQNMEKLKGEYPHADIQTQLWNITEPPPENLLENLKQPTLLYERYTLNYTNLDALRNIARAADIIVLGDWFNYTGQLFAYDEVFQKIGSKPMFYSDIKPILDECFPNQYIFDKRALDTIHFPTISLLICWK